MLASGRYRSLIWAGGYPGHEQHDRSDVDLYAVSAEELPRHWTMERIGGRRVELTVYPLEKWRDILAAPYHHAKHHFTFAKGMPLHDPEALLPELGATAERVMVEWPPASEETIAEMRNGVAIQRDKIAGFRQKGMALHLRMYAQGFSLLACGLLATARYGHSVDAGKNLTRLLGDPDLPTEVKELFAALLGSTDEGEMADASLALANWCLELTGGPVDSYNGGIPR